MSYKFALPQNAVLELCILQNEVRRACAGGRASGGTGLRAMERQLPGTILILLFRLTSHIKTPNLIRLAARLWSTCLSGNGTILPPSVKDFLDQKGILFLFTKDIYH